MTYEEKFYDILMDMYVGTPIKGKSGYVNLMTMKSKHFKKIEEEITKKINERTKEFPEFKEEIYERLYDFFKDYFTDTGSIYYTYSELNKNTYQKVYSENEDVSLLWKTQMLYYVKTDIFYQDIEFTIDNITYSFDVSKLEHKKNNEKAEIIFRECKIEGNNKITIYPEYKEGNKKTKIEEILKEINKEEIIVSEDELIKILNLFKRQSEVDYFINKDAKKFLRDRFDIYLYQYVFGDGERNYNNFNEKRINQLTIFKDIAYDVIDFISQFEDELVRIWEKPKFVLNSNYILTLNNLENNIEVIEKIINHTRFNEQIDEWIKLSEAWYDDENKEVKKEWKEFKFIEPNVKEELLIVENGKKLLNEKYKYLPIDTIYFEDIKNDILSCFENIEEGLDGYLIKSDNFQALNTLYNKFKEKIEFIYIDPPFNTGRDFIYKDGYQDSTWLTLMFDRLRLAKELMTYNGNIYLHLDYNSSHLGRILLDKIFGEEKFLNELIWCYRGMAVTENHYTRRHDNILFYSKDSKHTFNWELITQPLTQSTINKYRYQDGTRKFRLHGKNITGSPIQNNTDIDIKWLETNPELCRVDYLDEKLGVKPRSWIQMDYLNVMSNEKIGNLPYTQKPESLIEKFILVSSNEDSVIMDFFAGTGTTLSVAHKLNRKWIGIEMGEHFYNILLPRMKRVLLGDESGITITNEKTRKAGGFIKYYELEQYEDTLKKTVYQDDEYLIYNQNKSPYEQYVFLRDEKLNYCMESKDNIIKVDLSKLYDKIDIPETLSNLTGKSIKRITKDEVIFTDNVKVDINNIDYRLIKPLIWWCE